MDDLKDVFITRKEFSVFQVELANTLGEIRSNWRSVKWMLGLTILAIGADIVVGLLHLR